MIATSPPPTPPAVPPQDPDLWRFEDAGAACEWAEEYCPGGFHPVNLGDTFHDGKYRVIRKLGDGSYSTVWLAVSSRYASKFLFHYRRGIGYMACDRSDISIVIDRLAMSHSRS
jgi:serine/threonine protein kinase